MDDDVEEDLAAMARAAKTAVRRTPARNKEESPLAAVPQLASVRVSTPNPEVKHEGASQSSEQSAANFVVHQAVIRAHQFFSANMMTQGESLSQFCPQSSASKKP